MSYGYCGLCNIFINPLTGHTCSHVIYSTNSTSDKVDWTQTPKVPINVCEGCEDSAKEIQKLKREIRILRQYGNKDCTYMADEAIAKLDEPCVKCHRSPAEIEEICIKSQLTELGIWRVCTECEMVLVDAYFQFGVSKSEEK